MDLEEIPVNKAELFARIGGEESFDGGITAAWMSRLGAAATWRAVRDAETGHTIHVVSDRTHMELTEELLYGLRIMRWLTTSGAVVWYWWDQPWARHLPANTVPGRLHINGGFAVPGVREIHVYRREEALKVMIHEAIHALRLDLPVEFEPILNAQRRLFERDLGRGLWPHLGEAVTELLAEWFWAIVGTRRGLEEARRRWEGQMLCAERQAAQVWVRTREIPLSEDTTSKTGPAKLKEIPLSEDTASKTGSAKLKEIPLSEDTNVFAYYILKWVLMEHLDIALLGPAHGVHLWFKWWKGGAKQLLEHRASLVLYTEGKPMSMAMTCGYD
jgi:hypothetical protein